MTSQTMSLGEGKKMKLRCRYKRYVSYRSRIQEMRLIRKLFHELLAALGLERLPRQGTQGKLVCPTFSGGLGGCNESGLDEVSWLVGLPCHRFETRPFTFCLEGTGDRGKTKFRARGTAGTPQTGN